jgi:hypothetical protein
MAHRRTFKFRLVLFQFFLSLLLIPLYSYGQRHRGPVNQPLNEAFMIKKHIPGGIELGRNLPAIKVRKLLAQKESLLVLQLKAIKVKGYSLKRNGRSVEIDLLINGEIAAYGVLHAHEEKVTLVPQLLRGNKIIGQGIKSIQLVSNGPSVVTMVGAKVKEVLGSSVKVVNTHLRLSRFGDNLKSIVGRGVHGEVKQLTLVAKGFNVGHGRHRSARSMVAIKINGRIIDRQIVNDHKQVHVNLHRARGLITVKDIEIVGIGDVTLKQVKLVIDQSLGGEPIGRNRGGRGHGRRGI